MNISEQLLLFKSLSDLCWPGFPPLFTQSITEQHMPASQAWLRLVGDILCTAILVPLSVEEWHQVFMQLRNPATISNCFPNPELTRVLWKIIFGRVRHMSGLPTDMQAAWLRFARQPGNSPGQVSHGLTHLSATQPPGQLRLRRQKNPPFAYGILCGQTIVNKDFHVHVLAVFI